MEAIVEVAVAGFLALIEALITLVAGVVQLIAEIMFLLIYGWSEGRRLNEQRRKQASERRLAVVGNGDGKSGQATSNLEKDSMVRMAVGVAIVFGVIILGVFLYWHHWHQEHLKKATLATMKRIADETETKVRRDPDLVPERQKLQERDAWGEPLDLYVDHMGVARLVVVRSAGADGASGTVDDLLETRTVMLEKREAAQEVVKEGVELLKRKWDEKFKNKKADD